MNKLQKKAVHKQDKRETKKPLFLLNAYFQFYSGWIASEGQTSAQVPQAVQIAGSIT
jgi:hypothetical protein